MLLITASQVAACNCCRHRQYYVWGLGVGEVHHNNKIGLHGKLLNALKIPKKVAHLWPHSGIQLNGVNYNFCPPRQTFVVGPSPPLNL